MQPPTSLGQKTNRNSNDNKSDKTLLVPTGPDTEVWLPCQWWIIPSQNIAIKCALWALHFLTPQPLHCYTMPLADAWYKWENHGPRPKCKPQLTKDHTRLCYHQRQFYNYRLKYQRKFIACKHTAWTDKISKTNPHLSSEFLLLPWFPTCQGTSKPYSIYLSCFAFKMEHTSHVSMKTLKKLPCKEQ